VIAVGCDRLNLMDDVMRFEPVEQIERHFVAESPFAVIEIELL
jgi:hypothetical protein